MKPAKLFPEFCEQNARPSCCYSDHVWAVAIGFLHLQDPCCICSDSDQNCQAQIHIFVVPSQVAEILIGNKIHCLRLK